MTSKKVPLRDRYGRWAVIAGASVGLGAAFADTAAEAGFDVVLVARRGDVLAETAKGIAARHGVQTRCLAVDLAADDAAERIAAAVAGVDLGAVVYNAAAEPEGRFLDAPLDGYDLNLAVNCRTPTRLCYALGRRLVAQGRGAVALVSSMAALQGIEMFTTYGAAKAYELILAEGLWAEWKGHGVDVVGYVVGATASANFQGAAPDAYDDVAVPGGASNRILAPASPASVARRLFNRLDQGPRQYSHDTDEAKAWSDATRPRAEVVTSMGDITTRLARFQD